MFIVKLTYYKDNGKYNSEGYYETDLEYFYQIITEVTKKQKNGELPGMVKGYRAPFITIDVPIHPNNHPSLCILDKADPIEFDLDGWYFWDEIWAHRHGPYDNSREARAAHEEYCKTLKK
jgi:hypothetical protein